jgi:hypothetical protein
MTRPIRHDRNPRAMNASHRIERQKRLQDHGLGRRRSRRSEREMEGRRRDSVQTLSELVRG